jgi:TfoX/Sxy family transcriptional regulator of competence genes
VSPVAREPRIALAHWRASAGPRAARRERGEAMAYDAGLAQRVREVLEERSDLSEKKMFGGIAFLLGGNMCVGIVGDELMVRVGPDAYEAALEQPFAREMDFTGKPLRGMLYIADPGFREDAQLAGWVERGVAFAGALPAK